MLNVQFSNKVSLLDSGDLASAPGLAPGSQAAPVGETEGTDFGNPVQSQNATMSSLQYLDSGTQVLALDAEALLRGSQHWQKEPLTADQVAERGRALRVSQQILVLPQAFGVANLAALKGGNAKGSRSITVDEVARRSAASGQEAASTLGRATDSEKTRRKPKKQQETKKATLRQPNPPNATAFRVRRGPARRPATVLKQELKPQAQTAARPVNLNEQALPHEMSVVFSEFRPQHNRKASISSTLGKDYISSQDYAQAQAPRRRQASRRTNSSCAPTARADRSGSVRHTSVYLTHLQAADGSLQNTALLNSRHSKDDPRSAGRANVETDRGGTDRAIDASRGQLEEARKAEIMVSEFKFDSIEGNRPAASKGLPQQQSAQRPPASSRSPAKREQASPLKPQRGQEAGAPRLRPDASDLSGDVTPGAGVDKDGESPQDFRLEDPVFVVHGFEAGQAPSGGQRQELMIASTGPYMTGPGADPQQRNRGREVTTQKMSAKSSADFLTGLLGAEGPLQPLHNSAADLTQPTAVLGKAADRYATQTQRERLAEQEMAVEYHDIASASRAGSKTILISAVKLGPAAGRKHSENPDQIEFHTLGVREHASAATHPTERVDTRMMTASSEQLLSIPRIDESNSKVTIRRGQPAAQGPGQTGDAQASIEKLNQSQGEGSPLKVSYMVLNPRLTGEKGHQRQHTANSALGRRKPQFVYSRQSALQPPPHFADYSTLDRTVCSAGNQGRQQARSRKNRMASLKVTNQKRVIQKRIEAASQFNKRYNHPLRVQSQLSNGGQPFCTVGRLPSAGQGASRGSNLDLGKHSYSAVASCTAVAGNEYESPEQLLTVGRPEAAVRRSHGETASSLRISTHNIQTPTHVESTRVIPRARQMHAHGEFDQPPAAGSRQRVSTAELVRRKSPSLMAQQLEVKPLGRHIPVKPEKELQGSLRRLKPSEQRLLGLAKRPEAAAAKNQQSLIYGRELPGAGAHPYQMSSAEANRVRARNRQLIARFQTGSAAGQTSAYLDDHVGVKAGQHSRASHMSPKRDSGTSPDGDYARQRSLRPVAPSSAHTLTLEHRVAPTVPDVRTQGGKHHLAKERDCKSLESEDGQSPVRKPAGAKRSRKSKTKIEGYMVEEEDLRSEAQPSTWRKLLQDEKGAEPASRQTAVLVTKHSKQKSRTASRLPSSSQVNRQPVSVETSEAGGTSGDGEAPTTGRAKDELLYRTEDHTRLRASETALDSLEEPSNYGVHGAVRHGTAAEALVDREAVISMSPRAIASLNPSQLVLAQHVLRSALDEAQLTLSNAFINRNLHPSKPGSAPRGRAPEKGATGKSASQHQKTSHQYSAQPAACLGIKQHIYSTNYLGNQRNNAPQESLMTDFSYEQRQMRKTWSAAQRRLGEAVARRKSHGQLGAQPRPALATKDPRIRVVTEYKAYRNEDGSKNLKQADIADYYAFKRKQEKGASRKRENEALQRVWEQLSDRERALLTQINLLASQQSAVAAKLKDLAFSEFLAQPGHGGLGAAAEQYEALSRPHHVRVQANEVLDPTVIPAPQPLSTRYSNCRRQRSSEQDTYTQTLVRSAKETLRQMSASGSGKQRVPSPQPGSRGMRPGSSEPFLIADLSRASSLERRAVLRDGKDPRDGLTSGVGYPARVVSTHALGTAHLSSLDRDDSGPARSKHGHSESLGLVTGGAALQAAPAGAPRAKPANEAARRPRSDAKSDSLVGRSTDLIVTQSLGEKVMAARLQEPSLSPRNNLEVYRDEDLSHPAGRYSGSRHGRASPASRDLHDGRPVSASQTGEYSLEVQERGGSLKLRSVSHSQLNSDI